MLSQMGFHPFLMPLIMENRDAIGLTKDQVKVFRDWRNKNRVPLIHAMNQIIKERAAFQRIALNPQTREEVLYAKQEEIFSTLSLNKHPWVKPPSEAGEGWVVSNNPATGEPITISASKTVRFKVSKNLKDRL